MKRFVRVVAAGLLAAGAFGLMASVAGAEPEEAAAAQQRYEACVAKANATFAAAPAVLATADPAIVEVNFAPTVQNDIDRLNCSSARSVELISLYKTDGQPSNDWELAFQQAVIDGNNAIIATRQAALVWFQDVRCFRYASGGGVFCGAGFVPSEGL